MMKIAVIALAMLAAVPAAAQSRADRQMMADLRMLQEQTQQLAITLAALNDALKSINARIDQQAEASRKAFADQKLIVENVGADLRVIRERVDETNVRMSTIGQEMEALRNSVATSVAALQALPPPAPVEPIDPDAPPGTTPAPAPVTPPPPSTVGLSPTRMYEAAWADYTSGQWTLAITGFEGFLKYFPKSEMADEAQFYIGETHLASGKPQDALNAYNQVIQNYPASNSTPLAYYKRGLAQERLDEKDAARESWEFVVKTYPESEGARLAKQGLDRLKRKPGAE
jgi:tol-pal system protein YbgF